MTDPNAGNTGTATKPKTKTKNRVPLTYELLHPTTVGELKAMATIPDDRVVYVQVQTPPNVKKDKPRRDDFERGVKATLETGTGLAEAYNAKKLVVAALGPGFQYSAEVEEVTVRKVKVSKS